MPILNVALLQMTAHDNDQQANLRKGESFCRRARTLGADLALFPEMWSIGYTGYTPAAGQDAYDPVARDPEEAASRAEWQAQAIDADDAFVVHFRRLARELEMAIAITYLERWAGAPRNTVALIDRHGKIVLTYAKVHTCEWSLEAALTPGDGFYVADLDTAAGSVRIGAMICYDREHPESARVLMLKGAEIILVPNACDLEQHRLGQIRCRAYENMVGVAVANYAGPGINGHSIAVHPIAFDQHERSSDTLIIEAGEHEGVYLAPFDLDALREYRAREVWGNAYRKPRTYAALLDGAVAPTFVRPDSRR